MLKFDEEFIQVAVGQTTEEFISYYEVDLAELEEASLQVQQGRTLTFSSPIYARVYKVGDVFHADIDYLLKENGEIEEESLDDPQIIETVEKLNSWLLVGWPEDSNPKID